MTVCCTCWALVCSGGTGRGNTQGLGLSFSLSVEKPIPFLSAPENKHVSLNMAIKCVRHQEESWSR